MGSVYDRGERRIGFESKATPMMLGPGAYETEKPSKAKLRSDGFAPFASLSSRDINFAKGSMERTPGPGAYAPRKPMDRVAGGSSLVARSHRFDDGKTDVPGPGSYMIKSEIDRMNLPRAATAQPALKELVGHQNLKFERKPNPPSIPIPLESYGYEESKSGDLVPQPPPTRDQTIGPAFYKPKESLDRPAPIWGCRTSKRTDFTDRADRSVPGPGQYEPDLGKIGRFAVGDRHELNTKRFVDKLVDDAKKDNVPAPSQYFLKSQFESTQGLYPVEGMDIERPPFASQEKRFHPVKNYVPAPGTYSDPRTALSILKRPGALKPQPFLTTSMRFRDGDQFKILPGPGQYSIPGMGSDSLKKALMNSSIRGGFGSTKQRAGTVVDKEITTKPGPGHYNNQDDVAYSRYIQMSSFFASQSDRIQNDEKPEIAANVFSYDVDQSYKQIENKRFTKPRTEDAKLRQSSFMTAGERFLHSVAEEKPGPGAYSVAKASPRDGGVSIPRQKRFVEKRSNVPGPGQYTYSPFIADTVLRGTFNATLNNPVRSRVEV